MSFPRRIAQDAGAACWMRLSPLQRLRVFALEGRPPYALVRLPWDALPGEWQVQWRGALGEYLEVAQRLGGVGRSWPGLIAAGNAVFYGGDGWDGNGSPTAEVA